MRRTEDCSSAPVSPFHEDLNKVTDFESQLEEMDTISFFFVFFSFYKICFKLKPL